MSIVSRTGIIGGTGIIELDSARGTQLGFTSERFYDGSYLWDDHERVLISFVHSKAPGNFRRLVAAIHAEGKAVAVPTPLPNMERIVRKNGYVHSVEVTENGDGCDVWTLPCPHETPCPHTELHGGYCEDCDELIDENAAAEAAEQRRIDDGETYRGTEAASALAEEQAWIQRNLK